MKLQEIYELGLKLGIENDLRDQKVVKAQLEKAKKQYEKLSKEEKEFFDTETLENPYADSRILTGDPKKQVKRVLAGIDIDEAEVLLADRLGNIDLLIGHHPQGITLAHLDDVMQIQSGIYAKYGVPINIAEGVLSERIGEIGRRLHPGNHEQAVDIARILKIPFMIAHTICDNMVATFVDNLIQKEKPQTVGEILDLLLTVPEYKQAKKNGVGPMLFTGAPQNSAGKIVVTEFTGGTEGSHLMYERMAHAGIGTIISMHMSDAGRKEAQKHHINMVIAGHMSSDSLGMNLLLDQLEKRGVEIVPISGLIRVSRNKKK